MNRKTLSNIYLVLVALIWGLAFVAQSEGMRYLGPYSFSMLRSFVGSLTMFAFYILFRKYTRDIEFNFKEKKKINFKAGIVCGLVLFFAMNAQQIGIKYTTAGKAGFITTLYIVMIPVIRMFFGEKLNKKIIICLIFALTGMYLLSVKENFEINFGDIIVFISAIFYSVHTLLLSKYTKKADSIVLNMYQFLICGLISALVVYISKENINVESIRLSLGAILYVGVLSSGVAYMLQIIALKDIDPTIAALINSLEAIFAAIGGWIILGQVLSNRELLGCMIMFIATIIAQIPERKKYD